MKISDTDREILKFIQGDIPVESHPFLYLAHRLELDEEEIILRIKNLQENGIIRRFAAILAHYQAGFRINAMLVFKIDVADADRIGSILASYNEISHCYLREVPKEFVYNLFAMIHTDSEEKLNRLLNEITMLDGIKDYTVIKSLRELKKVSMKYI